MNTVNKFGHYLGSEGKIGPPGVGFMLTSDGNYDMQNRILTNIKEPVKDQDAVTLKLFKRKIGNTLQWDGTKKAFVCVNKRLTDLSSPEKDVDAVTLGYLKEKTLNCVSGDYFDVRNKRVKGIAKAEEASEAVNVELLNEEVKKINDNATNLRKEVKNISDNALSLSQEKFDARGKLIVNVAQGERKTDAVNLALLKSMLKIQGYYIQRDLADAVLHLRREIHDLFKEKRSKKEIETHLNSIEDSYKNTWRSVVQSKKEAKTNYSQAERKQIVELIKIKDGHLNYYLENE